MPVNAPLKRGVRKIKIETIGYVRLRIMVKKIGFICCRSAERNGDFFKRAINEKETERTVLEAAAASKGAMQKPGTSKRQKGETRQKAGLFTQYGH